VRAVTVFLVVLVPAVALRWAGSLLLDAGARGSLPTPVLVAWGASVVAALGWFGPRSVLRVGAQQRTWRALVVLAFLVAWTLLVVGGGLLLGLLHRERVAAAAVTLPDAWGSAASLVVGLWGLGQDERSGRRAAWWALLALAAVLLLLGILGAAGAAP